MHRFTLTAAALSLAATAAPAQTDIDALDWGIALNPIPTAPAASLLQAEEPAGLPSSATHSNTRLVISSRTWSEDLLDEAFGSGVSFGIEHDRRLADSGPGWETGLLVSYNDESAAAPGLGSASIDLLLVELLVGVRYTQRLGGSNFYAYAAGGADGAFSYVKADVQIPGVGFDASESDTDFTLGGYAHGGAYYQAGSSWTLGLDVRGSFGLEVQELDTDYVQVGVTLGYGH